MARADKKTGAGWGTRPAAHNERGGVHGGRFAESDTPGCDVHRIPAAPHFTEKGRKVKPATMLVYSYLAANRDRAVPANELLRNLRMTDYRSRISEIRRHLVSIGAPYRVESKRIKGQRTNEYRLIQAQGNVA